jgi:hypothetical protein
MRVLLSSAIAFAGLAVEPAVALATPTTPECLAADEHGVAAQHGKKLTEARASFLVCASTSCPGPVQAECAHLLDEVTAGLPTVVFAVKDEQGNDLTGVTAVLDGAPVVGTAGLDGTAMPVDPGPHTFRFRAPGYAAIEKALVIHEGEKDRRERVVLAAEGKPQSIPPPPHDDTAIDPGHGRKLAAITAGGVGAAALILGAVAAGVAASEWSDAKSACGPACAPGSTGQRDRSTALVWANVSTGAVIVGAALVATGTVLWITAPRRTTTAATWRPEVGTSGAGGALRWRF